MRKFDKRAMRCSRRGERRGWCFGYKFASVAPLGLYRASNRSITTSLGLFYYPPENSFIRKRRGIKTDVLSDYNYHLGEEITFTKRE